MDSLSAGTLQWIAAIVGAYFIAFVAILFGAWGAWVVDAVDRAARPEDPLE